MTTQREVVEVGRSARRRRPVDAVSVLSVFVAIMLIVPSPARFAPAGSLGAPATMFTIALFFWWLWTQANRSRAESGAPRWVRRAAILLLLVALASYGYAALRPLPADETTPLISSLVQLVGLVGLLLTAADGIPSAARMFVLIRRMTVVSAGVGMLAVLQFFTHRSWVDVIPLPGLALEYGDLAGRGGFTRPVGTATHTLEYGAVLAMVIPLAITRAKLEQGRRGRLWVIAAVLLFAAVASLSRSALLCTALALVVLALRWPLRLKLQALGVALVGAFMLVIAVPGLVGTLRGMFLSAGSDTSVLSRTDSYGYAFDTMERYLWLGKGLGTFLPKYWILDNGYLTLLVSMGVLGLGAFVTLLGAGCWSAGMASRLAPTEADREMSYALLASTMAGALSMAFFDIFAFPQASGMLFLVLGLCGAALRLRSASSRSLQEAER